MMTMIQRVLSRRSFTLIELLTVIAIIAILAGLLFPAIQSSLKKADATQAKTDIKNIETAIRAYYTEYGKLPVRDAHQGIADRYYGDGSDPDGFQYEMMDTLRAVSTAGHANSGDVLNPRKIVFFEPPSRKAAMGNVGTTQGSLLDPWGRVYRIKLDNDYNNSVEYYNNTNAVAVIVCYGPGGGQCDINTSSCDDITNLK